MSINKMLFIDGAPYSFEIWEWYHKHSDTNRDNLGGNVVAFSYHLEAGCPDEYALMNAGQFWHIFSEIFMQATGISKHSVDTEVTLDELKNELEIVKRVFVWFALAENLSSDSLGDVDYTLVDPVKKRLNNRFRYQAYYMWKTIENSIQKLDKSLQKMKVPDVSLMESEDDSWNESECDSFMKNIITENNAGDLDEFVLYTMSRIQFLSMTENHEKLAQLVRYERFENTNFDEKMPEQEIWRLLFPNFFDGVEDVFVQFYEAFKAECILFFFNDYLSDDMGITKIAFYNVYTKDDGETQTSDITKLIDTQTVKNKIEAVHKSYKVTD